MNNEEKRKARRFELALPVTLVAGAQEKVPVQTRDISSSGMLLEFDAQLQPGSKVELEVTLPGEITQAGPVTVRCLGRVVRVDRGSRTGVAVTISKYEFLRVGKKTQPLS